uniref:Uncharacterized protein n=1 Tax=Trichogramma kaykai TaxID=54128 RepID=A0ABD2VSM4_9HYME
MKTAIVLLIVALIGCAWAQVNVGDLQGGVINDGRGGRRGALGQGALVGVGGGRRNPPVQVGGLQGGIISGRRPGRLGNNGVLQGNAGSAVAGAGRDATSVVQIAGNQGGNRGGRLGRRPSGLAQGQVGSAVSGAGRDATSVVQIAGNQN